MSVLQIASDVLRWPLIVSREIQQKEYKTLGLAAISFYLIVGNPLQQGLVLQDYVAFYLIAGGVTVASRFLIDGSA